MASMLHSCSGKVVNQTNSSQVIRLRIFRPGAYDVCWCARNISCVNGTDYGVYVDGITIYGPVGVQETDGSPLNVVTALHLTPRGEGFRARR